MTRNRSSHRRCSLENGVLKNFANFSGKHFWHRCLPVRFAKFLRTPFFKEHLRWLLLKKVLVETFNNHYVNIVENSTGVSPIVSGTPLDPKLDRDTVEKILKHYENHPSMIKTKKLAN